MSKIKVNDTVYFIYRECSDGEPSGKYLVGKGVAKVVDVRTIRTVEGADTTIIYQLTTKDKKATVYVHQYSNFSHYDVFSTKVDAKANAKKRNDILIGDNALITVSICIHNKYCSSRCRFLSEGRCSLFDESLEYDYHVEADLRVGRCIDAEVK